MPIDTPTLSPFPNLPLAHSLGGNRIGNQGASALAAILKETQITNLGCAAARVFAFVSMPIDTPTLSPFPTLRLAHRLRGNNIGAEGATALAAILKETQITNLGCAAARGFAFVSTPADTFANTSISELISFLPPFPRLPPCTPSAFSSAPCCP
jgi:hypothetical protein